MADRNPCLCRPFPLSPPCCHKLTSTRMRGGTHWFVELLWFWAGIFSLELTAALLADISLLRFPCAVSVLPPPPRTVSCPRGPAARRAVRWKEGQTLLRSSSTALSTSWRPRLASMSSTRFHFNTSGKNVLAEMVMSAWLLPFSRFAFMFCVCPWPLYLCQPQLWGSISAPSFAPLFLL